MRGRPPKITKQQLQDCAALGLTTAETAKRFGMTTRGVRRAAFRHGVKFKRARLGIPDWLPDALIDSYRTKARKSGDPDAAAWARAEKRRLAERVGAQ